MNAYLSTGPMGVALGVNTAFPATTTASVGTVVPMTITNIDGGSGSGAVINGTVGSAYAYLSDATPVTVAASGTITVTSPPTDTVNGASFYDVWIGPQGFEKLQTSSPIAVGTNYVLSAAPSTTTGQAPTDCQAYCAPLAAYGFYSQDTHAAQSNGFGYLSLNTSNGNYSLQRGFNNTSFYDASLSNAGATVCAGAGGILTQTGCSAGGTGTTLNVNGGSIIVYRCPNSPYQIYWGSTAPSGCGTPIDTKLRVQ
jgi:hypothetical protein